MTVAPSAASFRRNDLATGGGSYDTAPGSVASDWDIAGSESA